MWQTLLRNKYLKNQTIGRVERKPEDSHFWSGLMKVKEKFLSLTSFKMNNGKHIHFWEDVWFGCISFKIKFISEKCYSKLSF